MKRVTQWLLRLGRGRRLPALVVPLAGVAFACLWAGLPPALNGARPQAGVPSEEATPDCDVPPADPFPARQRAQHVARLGAASWHAAGYKGRGVKVAVLDSGFRGIRMHLGKDLPARVLAHSFRADGNLEARDSQHGILCGEVIHALAPDAELLVANWDTDNADEFLAAARWARAQGARILSCSLIMPSWSDGEGGGAVNAALAEVIGSGEHDDDLLCFASAGNTAQRHWSGTFRDGGRGTHEWRPGCAWNPISPWGADRVSVELYWRPGTAYELIVTDLLGKPVGRSASHRGKDRSSVVVQFLPDPGAGYQVQVRRLRGPAGPFHLVVLGGGLDYATARGSVSCPADSPAVLAVGAVNGNGRRAGYSSCGPNSPRPKPDFVAPVPFPSLWRSRPFAGTSAAAPQAAGLAALCWSRHPDWTAAQVRTYLKSAAHDLGPAGHDWETGYGLIGVPPEPVVRASSALPGS